VCRPGADAIRVDARRIADEFAEQWRGTWVVTLDQRTIFHLRVVEGTRMIAVAAHPTMVAAYVEHVGVWCEAPATCRVASTIDREDPGVRWLTLLSRCPICLPKLIDRVVGHELAGLPDGAPGVLEMTPTPDTRGSSTRIGGSTVMAASATARQRLAGHAPVRDPNPEPAPRPAPPAATFTTPPARPDPVRRRSPQITPSTVTPPTAPMPVVRPPQTPREDPATHPGEATA
jgi:hypothetical protein